MTGDPSNAHIWADADVLVAFKPDGGELADIAIPADVTDPFGSDWDIAGLLDGDEGFSEKRDEDVSDKFAWGGILVRTPRKNFKLTRTFTALEDNDTTFRLRWPGSERGVAIRVPRPERVKVAFELRDGDVIHRVISKHEAEITVDGDVNENETDIASIPFVVTVFPDADGVLFLPQDSDDAVSA